MACRERSMYVLKCPLWRSHYEAILMLVLDQPMVWRNSGCSVAGCVGAGADLIDSVW